MVAASCTDASSPVGAAPSSGSEPLLRVRQLSVQFRTAAGEARAVDGVDLDVPRGKTLALVGESGCGKTVTALSLLRLVQAPGHIVSGSVELCGAEKSIDLMQLGASSRELGRIRGGRIGMVFQEAAGALSPVHRIGNQLREAIHLHRKLSRAGARRLALETLDRVGMDEPARCLELYPHQLSRGMRQRVLIALALVGSPELLIADEPTMALDATTRLQILKLLCRVQQEEGTSILLITHDLSVVAQMADEVAVMYLGRVIERGSVRDVMHKPRHPYTMGLLASLPSLAPRGRRLPSIRGSVPPLVRLPAGCAFHPRCDFAERGRCDQGEPPVLELGPARSIPPPGSASPPAAAEGSPRAVACWRAREIALRQLLAKSVSDSAPPPTDESHEPAALAPPPLAEPPLSAELMALAKPPLSAEQSAASELPPTAEPSPTKPSAPAGQPEPTSPSSRPAVAVSSPRSRSSRPPEEGRPRWMRSLPPVERRSTRPSLLEEWNEEELSSEAELAEADEASGSARPVVSHEPTLPLPSSLPPSFGLRGSLPRSPESDRPEPFPRASEPPIAPAQPLQPFARASEPPPPSNLQPFRRASSVPPPPPSLPRSLPPEALRSLLSGEPALAGRLERHTAPPPRPEVGSERPTAPPAASAAPPGVGSEHPTGSRPAGTAASGVSSERPHVRSLLDAVEAASQRPGSPRSEPPPSSAERNREGES